MTELLVDQRAHAVFVIRVRGPLDRNAAARLLRLVETERAFIVRRAAGRRPALILDLSGADLNPQGTLTALRHIRHSTHRAGVALYLAVGDEGGALDRQSRTRPPADEFSTVVDVDAAMAAIASGRAHGGVPAEVPPDPGLVVSLRGTMRVIPTTLRRLGRYDR